MKYLFIILFFLPGISSQLIYAQNESDKTDLQKAKTDLDKKKSDVKAFDELITSEAVTDEGLITVHKVKDKFYFELPFELFNKDLLLVSRISKVAPGFGGGYISAGSKVNEQVIQWSRKQNKILLKSVSYNNIASDSLPISISVINNNHQPIIHVFDIETYTPDSTAAVFEVNNFILSDNPAISGMPEYLRKNYKVKNLDKKRSFINRISSYPENVEVRHDMTYKASSPPGNSKTGTISMEMSQSLYLLPETPMQSRHFDKRVGWFTLSHIDYGSDALKAERKQIIRRWKLIPKDVEAYNRGELVEPEEPIVFYIDPATPEKWRPFFKQGIEDWNTCFETAGFKNAIRAKDVPADDPDWSAEDARYSTVRYVASTTRNAMGPSVVDPRSGEIIESDIVWYHNHIRSYRNRYLLETGAANPRARTLDTPLEDIGEMIRMVIAHEVGHALGLPHNMKASYAYPVDSLRSASFTQKWGLATTIMDYTRYNYVAQPGDEGVRWVRMLGPYDHYSINWGYRYISSANSPEEEKAVLRTWIEEKSNDPVYLFGGRNSYDPSSQTECVGDDPVKASEYGLSNLKVVSENLADWTLEKGEGFEDLEELYMELRQVWSRYVGHVITNIGGVYEKLITSDQEGQSYTHLSREEQQRAMAFLLEHAFNTPAWLIPERIVNNIGPSGTVDNIRKLQSGMLSRLMDRTRLERVIDNSAINQENAYSLTELFEQLRNGLWEELDNRRSISVYRRNLQREHVKILTDLMTSEYSNSDLSAVSRAELKTIATLCNKTRNKYPKGIERYHLEDIEGIITKSLESSR